MSLENHLETILGKALAAQARANRTINLVNVIETSVVTPAMENRLEPFLNVLEEAETPDEVAYAEIDDALAGAEAVMEI